MNIQLLTKTIDKVCPIDGLSSANEIWFKAEATDEQKALAWDIYNNWIDPPDPQVTEFSIALVNNSIISEWFESLPKIVCNLLTNYLDKRDFTSLGEVLSTLDISSEVKEEINLNTSLYYIPLSI
jgi:hypothetical protein